ncbi:MAG: efflux RND transporter periplasmic adaptor subunit [Bryobacterales bacterium]|nr:efflux RND transporter periplasmic adaptor subunit [Bryobacterales bacterium]
MSKPKRILAPVLVLAVVAAAVWWVALRPREDGLVARISGNIELTEVNIAFKTPGRLAELQVKEGDTVKAGQVLARLDTEQLESQRRMAQAMLAAAESRMQQLRTAIAYQEESLSGITAQRQAELRGATAQLDELREGSREQEKQQARAALRHAESDYARAEADWHRAETLFRAEDISAAEHDRVRAIFLAAQSALDQARERLALVEEGPRTQTIQAASAQVERATAALRTAKAGKLELDRLRQEVNSRQAEINQASASLAVIETQIADATVSSPIDGVVLVKSAEAGEVLAAGVTIATIGDIGSPWLRGYISQEQQGRVQLGAQVKVHVDSYPGRSFDGRLSFVAAEAEFTPKQIQTSDERAKLVYRVKVDLANPQGALKSNMPAEAEIPLLGLNP